MKRNPKRTLLAWLLTAAMLVSLLPTAAFAASGEAAEEESATAEQTEELTSETVSDEGYQLAEDSDSETATSGTCGDDLTWTLGDGVLTISGTGEMYDYDFFDEAPWYAYNGITSVVIEDGVTSIGSCAFYDCTGLTSVTIGSGVTSIGWGAFQDCTSLTSVTIPGGVTSIGDDAFEDCTSLASVTIPDSVTSIGSFAFYGCTGLTSVTIPDSVTSIGSDAFSYCTGLTSIIIPDSVTSIDRDAFSYCTGLTSVTIPDSVTSIGNYAFSVCTGLTSVTIPDSVTSIGYYAFGDCTGLTSIAIGSGVTSIDSGAFYNTGFYNDESNWEDGVLYLGNYLLKADADSLEGSYTIKEGTTVIADYAFRNCIGLTSVTISDSVTSIGYSAFCDCTGLTSVTIPDSVTSIGSSAFEGCTGLTSVTIPDSVTSIGNYAFGDCTGLTSIAIGSGVTSIGDYAFYNTAFYNDESNWENDVLYLGNYLLKANPDLLEGSYTIKESTTAIADYAFSDCTGLTSVTIPDSVTSIGDSAFSNCTSLTSVTIGNGVTSIGDSAFYRCTGLTSVTIPDSVTSIGNYAFWYCTGLTSVTIPDSVTSIGLGAFEGCTGLTSVTIPDSVTSIGNYAFGDCTGLTSIAIGSGVTSIGGYAFYNTAFYNDESNWEDGVLYLGNYLLKANPDSLEGSCTIKESTAVIADYAFSGCTGLTDVYYSGSESDWNAISIGDYNDCLTSATIHYNSTGPEEDESHTHSYTGVVTKEATCGENGVMTYTCSECEASYTETIPATGEHTAGEAVRENVVEATADTNGSYDSVVYCATCGKEISRETITVPATGDTGTDDTEPGDSGSTHTHTWGEGTVTLAATRVSEGEKTYTCTACGETKTEVIPALTAATFLFDDVKDSTSWYYDAVYWAYDLSITEGYSDNTFRPNKNCTRAEFATFLYQLANAYGLENAGETKSTSFTDVTESGWYYTYVMWAAENGLVSGYTDGTFRPNGQITRAEAVTMLYGFYRAFVNGGEEPTVTAGESGFSDLSEGSWYYTYMAWATQNGVVSGYTDGTCRPNTNCTRSVMVVLLYATANHLL